MYKLQISALATACRQGGRIADDQLLASIDGLSSDELFSDYIIDHDDPRIKSINIRYGQLEFHYYSTSRELWATVVYEVERELTAEETDGLVKYTLGQLSDGIGENLVQDYVEHMHVVINPVADKNKVKVEYINEE